MHSFRSLLSTIERSLSRRHKQVTILALDAAIAPLVYLFTIALVYGSVWPSAEVARLSPVLPALALCGGMASLSAGLPRIKLKTYASMIANGLGYYAAIVGFFALCLSLMDGLHFPFVGTLTFALSLFFASIGVRLVMLRLFLWVLSSDRPRTKVLIYGAGRTGLQLASALQSHEFIHVVAFVDDDPTLHSQTLMGKRIHPARQIESLVQDHDVTRVLLAMPSLSAPKLAQVSRRLQALGLGVQALPSFAQLVGTEELVETLTTVHAGSLLGRSHLDDALASGASGYRDRTVLVTGAGGSIGSELCRQLLAQEPRKLVLYEVSEPALYQIDRELRDLLPAVQTEIVPVLGSVVDARMTRLVLAQHHVDTVFHAAAYKHVPLVEQNPVAGIANNVFGTRTLVDACAEERVERFILVSTDKAVRPTNVMGASKRLAELIVQDRAKRSRGTRFSIVRFGNVLGSSGSVLPLFRDQISRGGPVTLTHEDVTRYFMTLSEAAMLVLTAGSFHDKGAVDAVPHSGADVFVLDMGKPVRIRQLAEQMIQSAGFTIRDERNPEGDIEIVVVGLRPGEKLHEELLIGQGLLTTPNPKILRADEESLAEIEVAHALRELGGFLATGDAEAARKLAMELVQPKAEKSQPAALAT
jgi:FlaA1/EpsC-like NDP-sugar epimerase